MKPILFNVGNYHIYSYGFFAGLAFIFGFLSVEKLSKYKKIYEDSLYFKLLILTILSMIFARISFYVFYSDQFNNWTQMFYFWQPGLTSFGGIIGAAFAINILFKNNKIKWFDIFSISFLLGLFFWRIGCFLSGDHPQVLSNAWYSIDGELPVILLESILGLIGYFIFLKLYRITKYADGIYFFAVIAYYGVIRLFVDQFRLDPPGPFELHWGQIIGIIFVIISLIGIIMLKIAKRGKND